MVTPIGNRLLADEAAEIQSHLREHLRMLLGSLHALVPRLRPTLGATKLPRQDGIERFDLLLGPLDAGAHHGRGEAALEAADCVLDDGEVDEGQLPNVEVQISLENALPVETVSTGTVLRPMRKAYRDRFWMTLLLASRYASRARSSKPSRVIQLTCCLVLPGML